MNESNHITKYNWCAFHVGVNCSQNDNGRKTENSTKKRMDGISKVIVEINDFCVEVNYDLNSLGGC